MDLDDLLKSIREEGTGGKIVPAKFFGEDKYDKYYKELLSEGRIKGDNLTPDERKEGVKAYRKGKINFQNFVDRVLEKKKRIEVQTKRTPSIGANGGLVVRKTNIDANNFKSEGTQENLEEVLRGIDSILETLKKDRELEEKKAAADKKKQENEKRKLQEEKLEKRFEGLRKASEKIIKPVKSILDRIIGFFTKIILGRIVFKLVEWLGDPKNQSKVNSIIRFLTDFGPKLLATYLVFGTGVGRAIRKLTGLLIKGAIRLGAAALLLLKKMGLRKAGGLARGLLGGRGRALATVLEVAGTVAAIGGISKLLEGDSQPDDTKEGQSPEAQAFNQGGKVEGPTGIDKVPAMLTAGEFVMSKGAVQKYGVDTLKEMNASGGGTNKPKVIQNKLYAQGGGYLGEEKEKPPARGLRPIIPQASSPVTNIFQQQGLARGTRATAGFTGMGKPGFDAISGGAKYIQSSKPQILGRGAYSAPTSQGAMRYAGSQGSLGGPQVPGGVIRTIVPGGAARIPFLEPQMKVAPEVFDKGKSLADKLQSGYRPNSALANRLRGQMASGAGRLPKFNIGGLKNLRGGSPLQMIANLALGNVLDRGVEAVGKPMGNALTRILLTLMGKKERASKINPELFGMMGPQLTPDMVENQQQILKQLPKGTTIQDVMKGASAISNKRHAELMKSTNPEKIAAYDKKHGQGAYSHELKEKLYRIYGNQSTGQTQPQSIKPTGKVVGRENLSPQAQAAIARLEAKKGLPPDMQYTRNGKKISAEQFNRVKSGDIMPGGGKPGGFLAGMMEGAKNMLGGMFKPSETETIVRDGNIGIPTAEEQRYIDEDRAGRAKIDAKYKARDEERSKAAAKQDKHDRLFGEYRSIVMNEDHPLHRKVAGDLFTDDEGMKFADFKKFKAQQSQAKLSSNQPQPKISAPQTAQLATTTPSVSLPSPPVRPQAKVTVVDGGATVSQTAMESSAASFVPPIPSPPKSASKSKILGIPLPF